MKLIEDESGANGQERLDREVKLEGNAEVDAEMLEETEAEANERTHTNESERIIIMEAAV
jgi:hypothetical protein